MLTFEIVSEDPVENVESSIRAESKKIVRGDGLGLAGFLHHEKLRQNGDGLQINGKSPQNFHKAKFVVEHKSQNGDGTQKELNPEKN